MRASAKTDAPPSGAESSNPISEKNRPAGEADTRKRNLRRYPAQKRKPSYQLVNVTIDQLRLSYYTQATLWPETNADEIGNQH